MTHGLVIGKFHPPHRGHSLLIATASERCDRVSAIVCDAGWHDVRAQQRAEWLRESFPDIDVLVVDQDALGLADDDSAGWASATIDALGAAPDLVFTSEDYGQRYAELLGAEHVMVDRAREREPISGREVRASPQMHLDWLDPQVRAHYVTRVCVLGAESTGKTTLAAELAERFQTSYVPEFGRFYCEAMPDPLRYRWTSRDFELIAEVQAAFEEDAARWAPAPLICDTNPFVTAVFHEAYLGRRHDELEASAFERHYDLAVVCDPATPFEQDQTGLRVDGDRRQWMHDRYLDYVERRGIPSVVVSGPREARVESAAAALQAAAADTEGVG